MRRSSTEAGCRRKNLDYSRFSAWLITAICVMTAPGCEEEIRNPGKRPETRALDQTGVSVGLDDDTRPQAPAKPPVAKQSGPIVGKRTSDIRSATKELQQGGARPAPTRIVARDPISVQGNAYVAIVGRASIDNMKHAVDLFHAENDRYPKDYDEFMTVIVKPHGIALPQLPPYQKYVYDENEHKLIIMEYPDLKN
jgi:hypothetical protein